MQVAQLESVESERKTLSTTVTELKGRTKVWPSLLLDQNGYLTDSLQAAEQHCGTATREADELR